MSYNGGNSTAYQGIGKLEAITVCVDYSDFLEVSLSHNRHHFDEYVIVTSTTDLATKAVADKHGCICVQTDIMTENHDEFNKGHAINMGLAHLRLTGWVLHLDADVILPDRFRNMLEKHALNNECVYGADRILIKSYAAYEKLLDHWCFKRQYSYNYKVQVPYGIDLGTRLVHNEYGYCPIGYFQLWHGSQGKRYPYNQGSAEHTDVLFSLQFSRPKRILLPEVIVYHLESENAPQGANWNGRKTKLFKKGA